MDTSASELPHRPVLDVADEHLMDLVWSNDPELVAALRELISLVQGSSVIRAGWNSAIDV